MNAFNKLIASGIMIAVLASCSVNLAVPGLGKIGIESIKTEPDPQENGAEKESTENMQLMRLF